MAETEDKTRIVGNETEAAKPPPPAYEYPNNGAPQVAPVYGYDQRGDISMSSVNPQVIVTQPGSILVAPFEDPDLQQLKDTNRHFMYFSIFVLVCCNLLFGAIGTILGSSAKDALNRGDKEKGRCLSRAGCAVSSIGIPISIIFAVVYFTVFHKPYSYYSNDYIN